MPESSINSFEWNNSLLKSKGALEEGKWEKVKESDDVDIYSVIIDNKKILVIAEDHFSGGANEAIEKLKSLDLSSACLLLEGGGDLVDDFSQKFPDTKIIQLPALLDGITELLGKKEITFDDAILATGLERVAEFAYNLQFSDEELLKKGKTKFLQARKNETELGLIFNGSTQILVNNFLPVFGVDMQSEYVLKKLINAFRDKRKFVTILNTVNQIRKKGLELSNIQQSQLIQKALEKSYEKYAVIIGKWHVLSLCKKGEIAEKSKELYQDAELQFNDFINLFSVLKK